MRTVKQAFEHNFGPGANYLTVSVPAGATCSWHKENNRWYVNPSQVPEFARHDAEFRGILVDENNLDPAK